jgi:hypothetical protein
VVKSSKQVHITLATAPLSTKIDAHYIEQLLRAAIAADNNGQDIDVEAERLKFVNKAKCSLITGFYRLTDTCDGSGIKVLQPTEHATDVPHW